MSLGFWKLSFWRREWPSSSPGRQRSEATLRLLFVKLERKIQSWSRYDYYPISFIAGNILKRATNSASVSISKLYRYRYFLLMQVIQNLKSGSLVHKSWNRSSVYINVIWQLKELKTLHLPPLSPSVITNWTQKPPANILLGRGSITSAVI